MTHLGWDSHESVDVFGNTYFCMSLGHLTPPRSHWQGNEESDAPPPNSTLMSIPASP